MENEKIILNIPYMVQAYSLSSDRENMFLTCKNLIVFSKEKKLFTDDFINNSSEIDVNTVVRENNLTDSGKKIFVELMYSWLTYTDNETGSIDRKNNIKMLEKYYKKIANNL
jgi:hypothetical protein